MALLPLYPRGFFVSWVCHIWEIICVVLCNQQIAAVSVHARTTLIGIRPDCCCPISNSKQDLCL